MSSSLTCTKLTLFTIAALLTQIIGLSLFVLGFFPVKPALSGVSGPESFHSPCQSVKDSNATTTMPPDQLKSLYQELSEVPPSFDRLIIMVIDGLPAEFLLGKDGNPPPKSLMDAMPYTRSLLAKKLATGYHAKAAPPTVTMPRLKAMVSGSIGGFLDVAFNFNTQALVDDNLIGQFLRIGWKMVILGDETWIKLFPGLFTRHDGVSSFFVKDTVQVDHNVSRHLSDELGRTDWNLLILHYLGLDHVGHTGGRNSVLMGPKLKEMDEVIKTIHLTTIQTQDKDQGRTLLMVVSDHGMTESGNHGGSSFEETDSLLLFIGLRNYGYESASHNTVYQVDIAPTLALLFGVPIPKNNAGVLIAQTFDTLTDDQQLRAMELNSWQLLRLLQAQLPDLSCGVISDDHGSSTSKCDGSEEEMFSCLYLKAATLHKAWKSKKVSRSNSRDDYSRTVSAYHEFLRMANEWLSRRATDKPFNLLASGLTAMLLSCLAFLGLLFWLGQEVYLMENRHLSDVKSKIHKWHLDQTAILAIILILVFSMGSSSLVEEEQYIWYFVASSFYLILLRKTVQSISTRTAQSYIQLCCIIIILACGRVLRGWHQGGVNWTHLPDISKWLEKAGSAHIKSVQLLSGVLIVGLSLYTLSLSRSKRIFVMIIGFIFLLPGLLVLQRIIEYQDSGFGGNLMAQIIFAVLGNFVMGVVIALPWLMPIHNCMTNSSRVLLVGMMDATYVIGWGYIFSWCLLQMVLQQPINSMSLLLLLVQILASICYSFYTGPHIRQWVEIAALYFLGMAGHFGLGNTNTLATIDVAGAFIGVSSHSTLLSGILMFIITYASPMLVLMSMVMYISVKDISSLLDPQDAKFGDILKTALGFPCLVPLGLNSVLLISYTVVLLLMRNHLFIWSVFSPKYLYVCATTACVFLGVCVVALTVFYTSLALSLRIRWQGAGKIDTKG